MPAGSLRPDLGVVGSRPRAVGLLGCPPRFEDRHRQVVVPLAVSDGPNAASRSAAFLASTGVASAHGGLVAVAGAVNELPQSQLGSDLDAVVDAVAAGNGGVVRACNGSSS